METKLLLLFQLLVLTLISLGTVNGYQWRPRVVRPKLEGKGDYQILSRRTQTARLPWKPPYSHKG